MSVCELPGYPTVGTFLASRFGTERVTVYKSDAYFNAEALQKAAQFLDIKTLQAEISEDRLNPLESFAVEVLVSMAYYKDTKEMLTYFRAQHPLNKTLGARK